MKTLRRLTLLLLAAPILLAGLAVFAVWLTLPASHTTLRIAGLSAPVDITLDGWGIPRIHASSETDAAAALGYLHARDRMFQMELTRRAASGRLAEVAGSRAVPVDRLARVFGERLHADRSYDALPANVRAILAAYASGVNAWLADNYRTELARAALAGKVSPERIAALWPPTADTPAPDSTVPPTGSGPASPRAGQGMAAPPAGGGRGVAPVRQGLLEALPAFPAPFAWPDQASNAWAVDSRHTSTGAALLAGDPHLALGFPALWYLARIETPSGVLVGATAPGVPFLVIGRNARIGWSFTTTGIDTQDVFVERALPDGMYATPDGPRAFETRAEVIHVRGAADVRFMVRTTRHGPVISDAGPSGGPVLAVAMASLQLGSAAPGLWALNHATSVADAGRAAAMMTAPMQNLTVAGPDGIGLFTTGQVPVRRAGDGSAPVAGDDGAHDWTGFAGGDSLPHFVAPASGTVENANERTAPPGFPVFLGRDFPTPIRALRIHALLASRPAFDVADFAAMQTDDVSTFAQAVLPTLAALPRQPGAAGRAQALLAAWNGAMDQDRPEPLIFNAALQLFTARALAASHVPEEDVGPWAGFAAWLLTPAGEGWCAGGCRAALGVALHDAVDGLAMRYGTEPAAWRWGSVHRAVFAHPILGAVPGLGALTTHSVAVDGDDTTLFRGGSGRLGDFSARHGAAYRGVYDVADLERSRFVVTPGQSGNVLSAHAWDMLPLWATGRTVAIAAAPETVAGTIRLEP